MVVGILVLELHIPDAQSLKQKRSVIKSLKQRMQQQFHVSVAEVDGHDKWQVATLGIAKVSTDTANLDQTFEYIDNFVTRDGRVWITRRTQRYA